MNLQFIIGHIYEVRPKIVFSFNGRTSWEGGFYELEAFSQDNKPIFRDGNKFFAADNCLIKSVKLNQNE